MTEIRWLIVAADGRLYQSVVAAEVHAALHKSLAGAKANKIRWSPQSQQAPEKQQDTPSEGTPIGVPRREGKGREVK